MNSPEVSAREVRINVVRHVALGFHSKGIFDLIFVDSLDVHLDTVVSDFVMLFVRFEFRFDLGPLNFVVIGVGPWDSQWRLVMVVAVCVAVVVEIGIIMSVV